MHPTKIEKLDDNQIKITWKDSTESIYSYKLLRDRCPCASCAGESVLFKSYTPPKLDVLTPGMYDLKAIESIGNYAIALTWGDGHNTGIYSWEYLSELDSLTTGY